MQLFIQTVEVMFFCLTVNCMLLFFSNISFIVMFAKDLNADLFSDAPSAVTFVTIIPNVYKPQMIFGISDSSNVEETPAPTAYRAITYFSCFVFFPNG